MHVIRNEQNAFSIEYILLSQVLVVKINKSSVKAVINSRCYRQCMRGLPCCTRPDIPRFAP